MTGLLVSVRDAAEAELAHRGGADLIDIKEPRNGSLGAASAEVVADVVKLLGTGRAISVALGELDTADVRLAAVPGVHYAKIGLAWQCDHDWEAAWRATLERIPASVKRVAVVYADWRLAGAPAPEDLVEAATRQACSAVLVDTWDKATGNLLDHWSIEEVAALVESVQARGIKAVLAGSLTADTIARLLPLEPDFLAVRGAVCAGGRAGKIQLPQVEALAQLVHSYRRPTKQPLAAGPTV